MDKKDIEAIFPLSQQQKGMFLETLLAPGSAIHVEQTVWGFQGELKAALFKQAWQRAIQRHAMLRTAFVWKNRSEPLQVTLRSAEIPFEQQNLSALSPTEQKTRVTEYLRADRQKGFDLSRAPLMRLSLFQTGESAYQVMWTFHHILMDGWCSQLVIQDVVAFYQGLVAGQEIQLAPSHPYQEYIAWLKQQDMLGAEKFWREMLQGPTRPTLPGRLDEAEDNSGQEERYAVEKLCMSAADTQALTSLSQKQHITFNTLLQGMWALLLSRYSGDTDVVFGATVSGRPSSLVGSETMVGLFINTLPLRINVQPNNLLWPWLKGIQTRNLDLRNYEYCSEGQVHQWSDMPASRPLFESILVFENYPVNAALPNTQGFAGDVRLNEHVGAQTKYALTLQVIPGVELALNLVWDKRRFQRGGVAQILEHGAALLKSFPTDAEVPLFALLENVPADQIPFIRPSSGIAPSENRASYEAPRTPTEKTLANVFAKFFEVEQIGRDDNFLGMGGSSLATLQLIHRVQETFQVEIPLQASFDAPTIAEFAKRIEAAREAAQGSSSPPMPRLARDGKLPLSVAQQAIWSLLHPDQPVSTAATSSPGFLKGLLAGRKTGGAGANPRPEIYPIVASVRIAGNLHQDALVESLKLLCEHHELLRVRFVVDNGQVFQSVCEDAADPDLQVVDSTDLTARDLIRQETQRSFDLGAGSLWRVTLCRLAEQSDLLVLTLHPLVADVPSARLLVRDLAELYQGILSGKPSPLSELAIQYADYAAWQQDSLSKDALPNQLDYWKRYLNGYKPLFPAKRPRSGDIQRMFPAFSPTFVFAQEQVEKLKALSQQQTIPWVLTLAATFEMLLYRCTNEEDIAVAVSIPNHSHKAVENVVGPFANYLTLRMLFAGEPSFLDVFRQLRSIATASLANQDVPFDLVTKDLPPNLIQVMFALEDKTHALAQSPDGIFSDLRTIGSETNFELCMLLQQSDAQLSGQIAYNPDLFDHATIERFVKDYQMLVENILNAPEHLAK
jgi:NRPS condensation-like uncharacterized protein/acyl carrier protein